MSQFDDEPPLQDLPVDLPWLPATVATILLSVILCFGIYLLFQVNGRWSLG